MFSKIKEKWKKKKERKKLKDEVEEKMYEGILSCTPGSKEMEIQAKAFDEVRGKEALKAAWIQGGLAFLGLILVEAIKQICLKGNLRESIAFEMTDHMMTTESGKASERDATRNR